MNNNATTFAIHATTMLFTATEVRGVVGSTIQEMEEILEFRKTFKDAWTFAAMHFPALESLSVAGFHFCEETESYVFILTDGGEFNMTFRFRRIGVSEIAGITVRHLTGQTVGIFVNTPQKGWIEIF